MSPDPSISGHLRRWLRRFGARVLQVHSAPRSSPPCIWPLLDGRGCPVVFGLLLFACAPPVDAPVRDVRPTKVESDEPIVIEGRGFEKGAKTSVVFDGAYERPGARTQTRRVEVPARAVGVNRVLVDADASLEQTIGRADFRGRVWVVQDKKSFGSSARVPVELQFFPRSLRKLVYGAIEDRDARRLSEWLGLTVRSVPGGGAEVVYLVEEFRAAAFLDQYDRPILDGKVTRQDLGSAWQAFVALDDNRDGVVTSHEAEHHEREAGHAARAGLRRGDVVTRAAGRAVVGARDFWAAWQADVPAVVLESKRGAQPIVASLPRHGLAPSIPAGLLAAGAPIAMALLVFMLLGPFSGLIVVAERRIAGQMQSRIGPNRVGPQGLLQWLADGIKLITKEDIVPTDADPLLFKMSPYFVWMGVFATFVVLPFSQSVIIADMNIGILYLISITALVVVGIIMGGWASNSKWSLLGGMRSAAQIISYEIPASVALLVPVMLAGTLSPQGLVRVQGGAPWHWNLFDNPAVFACFFIYFISALAEGNRTPFDLPEAESELVSGYNTEYSGFRFGVFFLAEWTNLYVIAAVATTVFLGGWRLPGVSAQAMEAGLRPSLVAFAAVAAITLGAGAAGWLAGRAQPFIQKILWIVPLVGGFSLVSMAVGYQLAGFAVFMLKALTLVFVIIWVRWTLPRFRVDQMMSMCWKYFIPLSFVCLLVTAAWVWLAPAALREGMRWIMFSIFGLGLFAYFVSRVLVSVRVHRARVWNPFDRAGRST